MKEYELPFKKCMQTKNEGVKTFKPQTLTIFTWNVRNRVRTTSLIRSFSHLYNNNILNNIDLICLQQSTGDFQVIEIGDVAFKKISGQKMDSTKIFKSWNENHVQQLSITQIFQTIRLNHCQMHTNGNLINVINVHLNCKGQKNAFKELRIISQYVHQQKVKFPQQNWFITGNFNINIQQQKWMKKIKSLFFNSDIRLHYKPGCTWRRGLQSANIDFALTDLKVINVKSKYSPHSDHKLVIFQVKLPSKEVRDRSFLSNNQVKQRIAFDQVNEKKNNNPQENCWRNKPSPLQIKKLKAIIGQGVPLQQFFISENVFVQVVTRVKDKCSFYRVLKTYLDRLKSKIYNPLQHRIKKQLQNKQNDEVQIIKQQIQISSKENTKIIPINLQIHNIEDIKNKQLRLIQLKGQIFQYFQRPIYIKYSKQKQLCQVLSDIQFAFRPIKLTNNALKYLLKLKQSSDSVFFRNFKSLFMSVPFNKLFNFLKGQKFQEFRDLFRIMQNEYSQINNSFRSQQLIRILKGLMQEKILIPILLSIYYAFTYHLPIKITSISSDNTEEIFKLQFCETVKKTQQKLEKINSQFQLKLNHNKNQIISANHINQIAQIKNVKEIMYKDSLIYFKKLQKKLNSISHILHIPVSSQWHIRNRILLHLIFINTVLNYEESKMNNMNKKKLKRNFYFLKNKIIKKAIGISPKASLKFFFKFFPNINQFLDKTKMIQSHILERIIKIICAPYCLVRPLWCICGVYITSWHSYCKCWNYDIQKLDFQKLLILVQYPHIIARLNKIWPEKASKQKKLLKLK